MKVLLAFPNNITQSNPFVKVLYWGLQQAGCDVTWDLEEFWNNASHYEIIHVQWPDSLFKSWNPSQQDVARLFTHIQSIKKHSKLVYTRHNERPHFTANEKKSECYSIIEQNADAIIHLGNSGVEQYKKINNTSAYHFIIPHHIYEGEYNMSISKSQARTKLQIPQESFTILSFGAFRDPSEASLILSAFDKIKKKEKYLLSPRLEEVDLKKCYPKNWRFDWRHFKRIPIDIEYDKIHFGQTFISDKMLPYYFNASDLVIIQRTNTLNSGNIPLAFLFKKAVIGPNVGNIGELLKQSNNPVFNPNVSNSLANIINAASKLSLESIGEANYQLAIRDFNVRLSAERYLAVYKALA